MDASTYREMREGRTMDKVNIPGFSMGEKAEALAAYYADDPTGGAFIMEMAISLLAGMGKHGAHVKLETGSYANGTHEVRFWRDIIKSKR